MPKDSKIVIVGAGQAAAQLCDSLRKLGHSGKIVLIGAEPWLPYQRPPLSKAYLLGDFERARLFLKPQSFYDDHDITLRLGVRVEAIDRTAKTVRLADGEAVAYDALVLATGARVRELDCPGAHLDGVHYVRGIDDIDGLMPQMATARHAVVVGGGYIGLEAAAVLRKRGIDTTVLHRAPRLLSRVASVETAAYFDALHHEEGVHIRLNQTIRSIEGTGRVEKVEIERVQVDAVERAHRIEIPADIVIAGIGVLPNQRIASEAELHTENGISVDEYCRSSDPAIYAIGDVSEHPHPLHGRLRLESVQNALDQAKICAANLMGGAEAYAPTPWFWSDQFDVKFQSAGLPYGYDRAVTRRGDKPRSVSHWLFAGEKLICVEAMNDPRGYMTGKRWLEQGKSPSQAILSDAKINLKNVVAD